MLEADTVWLSHSLKKYPKLLCEKLLPYIPYLPSVTVLQANIVLEAGTIWLSQSLDRAQDPKKKESFFLFPSFIFKTIKEEKLLLLITCLPAFKGKAFFPF